ncbi:MAG: hypothetical protein U5P41_02440 [Gammaproteobacteria bacterium]|nr:hypothetical protein [Gammaproteobacteria bacterium]
MRLHRAIWPLIMVVAMYSGPVYAYLDPGTGSMLISAIVGLIASLALAIKTYWYQFLGFMRRLFGRGNAGANPGDRDGQNGSGPADR